MKYSKALFAGVCIAVALSGIHAVQAEETYNWRNVEINGGGFVSGIIFHPTEPGLAYARTDIGGAYRWNNGTKRWIPLTDQFGNGDDWNLLGIESIAVDPSDPNRVYVAAGTYTNDWAKNSAMLRSTDRGDTWLRTDLPFKNGGNEDGRGMGERLIVNPRDPKTLFFGSRRNGLWRSGDYGATWRKVESWPAPENENGIGISFLTYDAQGTLYAGVASKTANLFASSDNGATWQAVAGAPQGFFPHHGVFASDGTLYLTYSNGPGPNGVSDGAVWKRSSTGQWSKITPQAGTGFGYAGLGVDRKNPTVLMVSSLDRWAQGDDIFRSTDGGATWKSVKEKSERDSSAAPYLNWGKPKAELGHWIGDVEIDPFDAGHVLYTTGATIWGSDNADALDQDQMTNWSVRAGGIEEVSVSKLISPPVGPPLVSGMRDIGGFVHNDLTKPSPNGMMDNPRVSRNEGLDFAALKPTLLVRSGDNKGGYSTNSGQSWTPFAGQPANAMDGGGVAISADGATVVWASAQNIAQVSSDMGKTWEPTTGLPAKAAIISDRVTPGVFYSLDGASKHLLVSTDGGATFSPRGAAVPNGFDKVAAAPDGAGDLWLTGNSGLMHSQDGGSSWTKIEGVASTENIGFGKAAPGATYSALYSSATIAGVPGIYRSDDEGQQWSRINDDRHQWGWTGGAITGDPRVYGRVFIATNGRGIIWGEPK